MVDSASPPGLRRARVLARLLDDAVRIPVVDVRVGLDSIIGLLPIGGDVVTGIVSLYVVFEAARAGVPKPTLVRMLLNIALDVAVGSVPVVGDVADVVWKANRRNVELFERHVASA